MNGYVFEVTTVKDGNTRTADRGLQAPTEHDARRTMVLYYLEKRDARVVSLKLKASTQS